MGIIEDIKTMMEEGKTEQDIVNALQKQGMNAREIGDYLTQTKIKQAVSDTSGEGNVKMTRPVYENQGMQPSMLGSEKSKAPSPQSDKAQQGSQQQDPSESDSVGYDYQPAPAEDYSQYDEYSPYQASFSPDMITEIAEQVVSEKLFALRNKIDSILDMKILFESRIAYLDERLKRIESIIDRLQLSVLQKVGEYVNNVEDLKNEVIETQKSFKSMIDSHAKSK